MLNWDMEKIRLFEKLLDDFEVEGIFLIPNLKNELESFHGRKIGKENFERIFYFFNFLKSIPNDFKQSLLYKEIAELYWYNLEFTKINPNELHSILFFLIKDHERNIFAKTKIFEFIKLIDKKSYENFKEDLKIYYSEFESLEYFFKQHRAIISTFDLISNHIETIDIDEDFVEYWERNYEEILENRPFFRKSFFKKTKTLLEFEMVNFVKGDHYFHDLLPFETNYDDDDHVVPNDILLFFIQLFFSNFKRKIVVNDIFDYQEWMTKLKIEI